MGAVLTAPRRAEQVLDMHPLLDPAGAQSYNARVGRADL
jgi:hypothetical protein